MNLGTIGKYKSWLTSAGIAIAIAFWLASGNIASDDQTTDVTADAAQPSSTRTSVRVRSQAAEEVTRIINVNGKTAPARVVEINAETDGRVVAIGVERGERLDAGQVIVRLDERDRQARLAQAEATVKQRELEYAARSKLMNESYVSEAQLQEAAALLETAKAELARAELDIDYMVIRAPFNGALQDRMVEIGDYVKAGDPVARFVDERKLIVSADVSEFDAHHVIKGNAGSARLATGQVVEGTIRYVAPVAEESTRTFRVELEVDNAAGSYRGGMTAELMIPAETVFAHRISPSLLTLDDEGNLGVKTVNELGQVEFHLADIAMSSSEGVWVAGLPHNAMIITVGQGFVTEGAMVNSVSEVEIDTAVAIKSGKQVN
jgi:multidrug efflux system membrane fusion protein